MASRSTFTRRLGALAVAGGLSAAVIMGSGSMASAGTNPDANMGCPSGYVWHYLSDWAGMGYTMAPVYVDDPAHGGNDDHIACGNDIGKKDPSNSGLQLYEFRDNNVPG